MWTVSDSDFNKLCSISDDDWKNEWGWWRFESGSNIEDSPIHVMKINGKEITAYYDNERVNANIEDYLEDDYITDFNSKEEAKQQLVKDYFEEECNFENLTDYCCRQWGASNGKNVCAITNSLAKRNKMTLSELFNKYQN